MIRQITAIALLCASGAGCTSMDPYECIDADWFARGQSAARAGLPVTEVLRQQNVCVHHGVLPNRGDFIAGWRHEAGGQATATPGDS